MSLVVAIDGPAAAGKGTLARALARELGWASLETGLLYRAVAWQAMAQDIDPADGPACTALARTVHPGTLCAVKLRGESIGRVASKVSCIPGVRAALFDFQREFAANPPDGSLGAVLDGRDIGTVICPDATLKIYLKATIEARANRRLAESRLAGDDFSLADIVRSLRERDDRESSRAVSPMRPAHDAEIVDTSCMTPDDVLQAALVFLAARRTPALAR